MSETANNPETSILLPQASLAVFSHDEDTVAAVQYISQDWRFTRVVSEQIAGDVDAAIAYFAEHESPDLIVIQTDVIDGSFSQKLEELAGHCSEGTGAIIVGPDNDVNLYRRLIDMGVSDYLVRPLNGADFSEVIAKALIEKLGISGSRLIAFVGAKGGVGTSALAQAYAWGVSDVFDQKTFFIDASGGWSVASVGMGFEPSTTLAEAAGAAESDDEESLNRMVFKASEKLHVLASGGEMMLQAGLSGGELERLLDFVMSKYPAVLIDLSHVPSGLMYTVLNKAHHVVVVSSPSVSGLRLSRSLLQEIKNVRGEDDSGVSLLLNMMGAAPGHEVPQADIEPALEFKPSAYLDFNPSLFMGCESEGQKIIDHKEGPGILKTQLLPVLAQNFGAHVDLSADAEAASGGVFSGLMSKLKTKPVG